jgi:hypothetical protein
METIRHDVTGGTGTTVLEELVVCECGHTIGLHDSLGCRALRPRACACSRDRGWVLDAAVARSVADPRAPAILARRP